MSQFNKRHYQTIAATMQTAKETADLTSHDVAMAFVIVENALADTFKADNSQFKRDLFIQACRPGQNVRARSVA